MSPKTREIPIVIWLRTAQNWLRKLRYEYRDMCKNIFVDGHKWSDIIEDYKNFFWKIEEFKSYIVEFEENGVIKPKIYLFNYAVKGNN